MAFRPSSKNVGIYWVLIYGRPSRRLENRALFYLRSIIIFLALIPKKSNHKVARDFQSIALCNTIYKILLKVLVNRIIIVLPKIISEEQTSIILDGIIIIQEIIHSIWINKEASLVLKLDLQKAYDTVEWRFLYKTFEGFN